MNCWLLDRSLRLPVIAAWLVLAFPVIATATSQLDPNGPWLFRIDADSEGEKTGCYKTPPEGTEQVLVPHSWNIGKYDDYQGIAWYFRTFALPSRRKVRQLHFNARLPSSAQQRLSTRTRTEFGLELYRARGCV